MLGMLIEVSGVEDLISIGDHCSVETRTGRMVLCEVVGFRERYARVLPFGTLEGIGLGCRVEIKASDPTIYPDESWLGRVVDAFVALLGAEKNGRQVVVCDLADG